MEHHQWMPVEGSIMTMKCIHCEELIDIENTEHWNLEIFADCPNR